jgi:ABC-type uncharacterized transport system YnjBCD substrate-binding protein
LSVTDDWKTFTLKNRKYNDSGIVLMEYPSAKERMIREKASALDSDALAEVIKAESQKLMTTKSAGRVTNSFAERLEDMIIQRQDLPVGKFTDDSDIHIMTLELQQLPPNLDEGHVKRTFFQG